MWGFGQPSLPAGNISRRDTEFHGPHLVLETVTCITQIVLPMQRCVAIHANGTSEVLEFHPELHKELRRLGYRRFVVRTADGRALSSAVYARSTPSSWQFSDAAKKLWGLTGDVQAIDDSGELVTDTLTPAAGAPLVSPNRETRVPQPAFDEERDAAVRKAGVGRETPPLSSARVEQGTPARPRTRVDPRQLPELIARANHSLPDADPRKITRAMVSDLAGAARQLRLRADPEQGALADRLERHARALATYLRPRGDDERRSAD